MYKKKGKKKLIKKIKFLDYYFKIDLRELVDLFIFSLFFFSPIINRAIIRSNDVTYLNK